jgi:hypothetical protein
MADKQPSSKGQIYLAGGLTGMVVGFLAAYFYTRAADEAGNKDGVTAADFVKLGLTVLGLVRQVTELGTGGGKK